MKYELGQRFYPPLPYIHHPTYGVVDGVAGAWSNPRYITTVPQVEFAPGTHTYYGRVAQTVRRSYHRYILEVDNND